MDGTSIAPERESGHSYGDRSGNMRTPAKRAHTVLSSNNSCFLLELYFTGAGGVIIYTRRTADSGNLGE
jgi:hypothetical protein